MYYYYIITMARAHAFNQPLTNFDTSQVTNMQYMFYNAAAFNQPLTNFDTSQVTNMAYMFQTATAFEQDISSWAVSRVAYCSSFCNLCTAPSFCCCNPL